MTKGKLVPLSAPRDESVLVFREELYFVFWRNMNQDNPTDRMQKHKNTKID